MSLTVLFDQFHKEITMKNLDNSLPQRLTLKQDLDAKLLPWGKEIIKKYIPHRDPFLLIDSIIKINPNELSISATKEIHKGLEVFKGHFPNKPIYPGVLIIEGIAQTAATLIKYIETREVNEQNKIKISMLTKVNNAKFRLPVIPNATLRYDIILKKRKLNVFVLQGKASVNSTVCSEVEFSAAATTL